MGQVGSYDLGIPTTPLFTGAARELGASAKEAGPMRLTLILVAALLVPSTADAGLQEFVRSDCNADGLIDLGDAIQLLNHLFDSAPISCSDACDGNDDGLIDIADAIHNLSYLFTFGPAPTAPFPDCGNDPTDDFLDCTSFDSCSVASISYGLDIQPIWDAHCTICHAPGGVGVLFAGLDLETDSYNALVGVPSTQAPLSRVEPFDPNASYLWHKLNGTQLSVGGTGQTMPIMGPPLDAATLALIEQWILEGANP